ncbi:sensor histidine kinase [Mucilaginibacter celer]|uniref:sensor histidine kinase n=1 Tax=Mucilaginibacter celer TaxID=2305508 RepID=UPI0013CE50D5|nr:histidine kinase [Mucilaginibacter celer]
MKQQITISLYWKCQLIGWSLAAVYWGLAGYNGYRFDWLFAGLMFVTDVIIYILITHSYRNIVSKRGWKNLDFYPLIIRLIPSVLILGLIYLGVTILKVYYLRVLYFPHYMLSFSDTFSSNWLPVFMAGIRLMAIWLLAYHLYHYSRREINAVKENSRLALTAREMQLNNLSAQLNPHFLFNSLNNIKALIIDDPKSARRAVDLLADLLRNSLYKGDRQLITINEELELVKDYLELEKLRLEERLSYTIGPPDEFQTVLIPRLSIQTLVENAIKHGIAQRKQGGLISIAIVAGNSCLMIVVSNTGCLMPQGEHGLGIQNLNERLQLHYKGKAGFTIGEAKNTVTATIKIPLV